MAQIQAAIAPGGSYSMSTAPTQPVAQPNSSLMQLYQEILRRRAAPGAVTPAAGGGYPAPVVQAGPIGGVESPVARAAAERQMQEEKAQSAYDSQLRAINLNPPKKYIESRPGISGGYADDVSMLPLSMRPGAASITQGPQNTAKAQGQFQDDQFSQAKIDRDRARSADGF